LKQYLINQHCNSGQTLLLRDEEFHYLCHVRRQKIQQSFNIKDCRGKCFKAVLSDIVESSCTLLIQDEVEKRAKTYEIELYCCLPKGKKLDGIIRQATEAGVSRIIPLFSDHSLIHYQKENDFDRKKVRWEKIIKEAQQQSGSAMMTTLTNPLKVCNIPDVRENEKGYYCHQDYIRENSLRSLLQEDPWLIRIVIGPEGGLSNNEIQILEDKKFNPFYLGDNVLRTETACLFAISSIITAMELL